MRFQDLDISKTYWNGTGKYQHVAEYVEQHIKTLEPDLGLGISINLAEKYRKLSRRYYEFYNDGKQPRGLSKYHLQHTAKTLENSIDTILYAIKQNIGI